MRIFTSSWFTRLPDTIKRIGISRGTPRGQPAGYRLYKALAPGPWFNTASVHDYRDWFYDGLHQLDPKKVLADLEEMAEGKDCALLCFEPPFDDKLWCHRGYVSHWMKYQLDLDVIEYGDTQERAGAFHCKIPLQYRRQKQEGPPLDISAFRNQTCTYQGAEWTLIGQNPKFSDQALIRRSDGMTASISGDVMRKRFKPKETSQ